MKKALLLTSLALSLACPPGRALDLKPRFAYRADGDNQVPRPYFVDGKTRYVVDLPAETTLTGESNQARFDFEESDGGTFVIRMSPLKPALSFEDEKALETYRKTALELVPVGATEPAITQEIPNPLARNFESSYRFLLSLKLPGKALRQEITFLDFNATEQLVLVVTAPESSFDRVKALSAGIMRSWCSISPEVDLTVPVYP